MKIVQWVNVVRAEGVPISSQLFRWYAMEVAREAEIASFVASPTWQKRFLKRHRLSMRARTRQGQIRPEDAEARAAAFAEKVREEMRELGVSVVYNADQTEKQRCTVMLLADSNGVKFDPTVVLKTVPSKHLHVRVENIVERQGFGRHVWKRIKPLQTDTKLRILSNNPTGWWNEYVHREFLQEHFGNRANVEEPVLLLLDEFSGHWTPETKAFAQKLNVHLMPVPPGLTSAFAQKLNVHLMPVPPGLTSVCQPADVSWMRPFKDYLRHEWVSFLRHQVSEHVSRPGPPTPFKMRAPKDDDVCRWVRTAWDRVTPGTIMAGFPQLLLVDTTHKTNRYNYQLLTFMVMDEVGNGRSVQHSVLETNSEWHMHRAVQHFKRAHADSWKLVRVIMVDKDLNEIRVLEKHFPEAQVLICHFHVIKYLGIMCRKPDFGKMSSDDQTSIDAAVHGLVYAESAEEYEERWTRESVSVPHVRAFEYNTYAADNPTDDVLHKSGTTLTVSQLYKRALRPTNLIASENERGSVIPLQRIDPRWTRESVSVPHVRAFEYNTYAADNPTDDVLHKSGTTLTVSQLYKRALRTTNLIASEMAMIPDLETFEDLEKALMVQWRNVRQQKRPQTTANKEGETETTVNKEGEAITQPATDAGALEDAESPREDAENTQPNRDSHSNNSDSDFEERPTFGIRLNPVAKKTGRPVLDKAKKAGAAREQRLAYKKTEAARRDIGEVTLEDVLHRLEKEKPALSTTLTRLRKIPTKFGKEESRRPKYEVVNRPVLNEDAFYLLPKKLLKASIKCLPLTNTA
ncbi:hypothetical protein ATCC90586_005107 [Pythium insidiosum]|nr:hypothetical protein ATCC90586_005107 [Pythium insidiosum]